MVKLPTMIFGLLIGLAVFSKAQPQFREFKAPREVSQISMTSKPIIEFDEKMTSAQKEIAKKIVEDDFMEFSAKGTSYMESHREEIQQKITKCIKVIIKCILEYTAFFQTFLKT